MDYSDVGQEQQAPSFVNMDAERAVLGAALVDDDTALRLSALVDAGDYYSERHKWIHDAVCRLSGSGVNVDMLTLADELQRVGKLESIGGHYYLSQLDAPLSRNVEHYAAIVKRQAWLRKAIGSFTAVIETAYNEQNPDIVFAMAQETLQTLRLAPKKSHVMTWEDSFSETLNMLEGFERGDVERMRWPWRTWNEYIDPPEPGLVVELAADTGVGKTIYAECMGDFWAKNGVNVGMMHFELNHHIMLQRRLARWTGYPLRTIKAMTKPDEVMDRIMSTSERLDAWRGRVDYAHTAGMDIDQTALEMARMVELYGTEVFILDHAKKLHGQTSPRQMRLRMNRTEREGDNIAQFKTACETLGVCGIVLNHYNKSGKIAGKEASRNDIAGSGEQSDLVNVIVLIDREEAQANEYDPDSGELVTKIGQMSAVVRCKVAKQTMGPEGETFHQWMQAAQFSVVDREFTNGLDPDA
jgi:replicative DNA helicase